MSKVQDAAISLTDLNLHTDFTAVSIVDRILSPGLLLRFFNAQQIDQDRNGGFQQVLMSSAEAVALANALLAAASANEDRHADHVDAPLFQVVGVMNVEA